MRGPPNYPTPPSAKKKPGDKRSERTRANAVLVHVASGLSLRAAGQREGLSHSSFLALVARDEEFRIAYETARVACIEANISGIEEQADEVITSVKRGAKNASALVSAFARKQAGVWWVAERLMPKKYGARLEHAGKIDLGLAALVEASLKAKDA